ncbi:hypothetical protein NKG94_20475 [Micromonospora sp. M12]
MPELTHRIGQLAERHSGVLLCGHSHGSALLALAVLRLPPRVRQRVALLTYGSPLDRLYARLFPAYLNEEVLRKVGSESSGGGSTCGGTPIPSVAGSSRRTGRVIHRRTPPIRPAGSTGGCGIHGIFFPSRGAACAAGAGHHPGESDPEFRAAVRELAEHLRRRGRG